MRTKLKSWEEYKSEKDTLKSEFEAAWPKILKEIAEEPCFQEVKQTMNWLEEVLVQNVPNGKKTRALIAVRMYQSILPADQRTDDDNERAYVAGWCNEILQAAALMADDIMDDSETRRGMPCWYRRHDVGLSAINDVLLLENLVYYIITRYYNDEEYYIKFTTFIHVMCCKTIMGQSLDTRYFIPGGFDLKKCTMENYAMIVKYKTSYYTFFVPIGMAMISAKIANQELLDAVEEVTLLMGHLFQTQDDFLDCFGDPEITGKVGTDIIDGKCTWLICKAAELAGDAQKQRLQECYGSKIAADEKVVVDIYKDLKLPLHYVLLERKMRNQIVFLIQKLPSAIPKEPLLGVLGSLYRRKK